MTKEQEILIFAEKHWGVKDLAGIGNKLGEESGEVLGAIVKIPEGRASIDDLMDEAGDVLIVLSQLAAKYRTTLEEILARRFTAIQNRARQKAEMPS